MKKLINNLPNHSFSKPSWDYLQNIQLADPDFNVCRPIDLLLGAEVYSEIIMSGIIKENVSLPIAQQTQLGWILSGNVKSYQCNVIMNNIEDIQRFWSIEDVIDPDTNMSSEDQQCLQQYHSETVPRDDGRYVVRLPLKPDINEKLGESKQRAVAQFYQLERKFSRNKNISEDYKTFINEYIKLGHMRKCTQKILPDCILPHLCVLRPDSATTSLRVVFNASAKTSTGYSLNDLMYSGPNLQQDLFTLILKWRQYEYAITADIEKMFRQILCNEKDLQYQKIVWRDSPTQLLREYELTTVTYGTKAAPFLAMMTLKRLAKDERSRYPTASAVLEQCFYMDDLLAGHHSIEEAEQLKADLINLLKSGAFNLRKWSSNNIGIQESISDKEQAFEFRHQESTKTLRLRWHPQDDQFKFQLKIDTSSLTPSTKRSLLSDISKIFDPLGWLSPVSTKLKLLFQKVWSLNLQWDDAVHTNINEEWLKIKKELPQIEHINVPRWLQTPKNANIELHRFCDSSEKAYACVIYGRIINSEKVECQSPVIIVAGKSKLVPVNKSVSLPRLELCAAHLLSKLMKVVTNCLSTHNVRIYGWCDSTAVLGWLHGDPNRWKPFVANRVVQITEIISTNTWRYVKLAENPADCASRGLSANQLQHHPLWWHGPTWLSTFTVNNNQDQPTYVTHEEIRKSIKSNAVQQNEHIVLKLLNKFSNFELAARVLAWTLRAIFRKQHKPKYLTVSEIKIAKHLLIKQVQLTVFKEEVSSLRDQKQIDAKSKLLKLNPFLDQDGLLRVGVRLNNAKMSQNMKHPLRIPHNTHLSALLIDQGHQMSLKRPITKLSILPINDNNQSHDTEKQEGQTTNKKYLKPASSKLCNFIITTLVLLMFICSGTCEYKISKVAENKNIFFDKLANMKLEREEWKLIVYCDMAPYWQGINLLNKFITHLDNMCSRDQRPQCNVVRLQLLHGYNELEHYHNLLLGQQGQVRRRRGLINGIGYVAHSLFGVLDETFAEQYQKDIALIRSNQKHLSHLWRNQTSVVEAELNVIKRECHDSRTDLNLINSYLYFCCVQCSVRVICDNNITIEQLSKTGVITLGDSCVIKDRMFTIYAHRLLSNTIKTKIDVMNIEIPPINHIINLSIPLIAPLNETDNITGQREDIKAIEKALKEMKSSQELADQLTFHDIHHYVAIYILVGIIMVGIILYAWQRMGARQPCPAPAPPAAEQAEASVSYVAPVATAAGRPTIATTSRGSSPSVRTQFNEIP